MMRLGVTFPGQDIRAFTEAMRREMAKAHSAEMARVGRELRDELRADTGAANLGRLAMAWGRPRVYPEGREHIAPAVVISSKAPLPIRAFEEGAVIRSRRGGWIAIPTPAVRGMRGHASIAPAPGGGLSGTGPRRARITPKGFAAATGLHLRFVYTGRRIAYLVASGIGAGRSRLGVRRRSKREAARGRAANAEFIAFWLVPQATIRKRLNISDKTRAARDRLAARLPTALERAAGAAARSVGA